MVFPNPPDAPEELPMWIADYLTPRAEGQTYRAHQFTINGVTWPFVRDMHFAALPYPINRKYSMLAGLFLTRPGDLIFFFQSDPQWSDNDINSRRGLRGIYRVISVPFSDSASIVHPSTGFTLLGRCPNENCGTFHSHLSKGCIECENSYPHFTTPKGEYHLLVTNLRLDLEPLVVFERPVSDEKAYGYMSDPGMIWNGRHDNAMGKGKGSSIRQLLTEEAVKLTRLFVNEPDQRISRPAKAIYPNAMQAIQNVDGTPATNMEITAPRGTSNRVREELMINFYISKTIDILGSNIQQALGGQFMAQDLEYVSTEFPWGYTASTSDFVFALARNSRRYRVFVMEFKADWIDDDTVIQSSLYVPWVVQVMSQFSINPIDTLEIVPVAIGRRLKPNTCKPMPYQYTAAFNSGVSVIVDVKSQVCLTYAPTGISTVGGKHYATDLSFSDVSGSVTDINWRPILGTATSSVERNWAKLNSWTDARQTAGLNRLQ